MEKKGYNYPKRKDTIIFTVKFVWQIYYITIFSGCKYISRNSLKFLFENKKITPNTEKTTVCTNQRISCVKGDSSQCEEMSRSDRGDRRSQRRAPSGD